MLSWFKKTPPSAYTHTHICTHTEASHTEPHSSFHPVPPRMIFDLGKTLPAVIEPIEFIRSLLLMMLFCVLIYFGRGARIRQHSCWRLRLGRGKQEGKEHLGFAGHAWFLWGNDSSQNLGWFGHLQPCQQQREGAHGVSAPGLGVHRIPGWFGWEGPSISFHPSESTLLLPCGILRAHLTSGYFW